MTADADLRPESAPAAKRTQSRPYSSEKPQNLYSHAVT